MNPDARDLNDDFYMETDETGTVFVVDATRGHVDERGGLEYQRWPLAGTQVAPGPHR